MLALTWLFVTALAAVLTFAARGNAGARPVPVAARG